MLLVFSIKKNGKFWSINMNGFRVLPQRGSHHGTLHPTCLSVGERSFDVCSASVYPTRHTSVLAFMQQNVKSWTKNLEPSRALWKRSKHNSHTCCSKNTFCCTRLTKLPTKIGRLWKHKTLFNVRTLVSSSDERMKNSKFNLPNKTTQLQYTR